MFERNIYDMYGLYCDSRISIGDYEGFQAGNRSYVLLPKEELLLPERDMLSIIDYLHAIGDTSVLQPLPTMQRYSSALIDGQYVYVCPLPASNEIRSKFMNVTDTAEWGGQLANFHQNGKQLLEGNRNHDFFGQWHQLWIRRLEQLEGWYEQVLYEGPQTSVDEAFLFSFPYYMGLTENAIQYVVDTMIDDTDAYRERPTICHRRFTDRTWLILSEHGEIVKRPTEFIYDHPSRDLAEWIRNRKNEGSFYSLNDIQRFLEAYEQFEPLTAYFWRMLYARLLFPLHYYETIEHYYRSQVKEIRNEAGDEFFRLLKNEPKNEQFLKVFGEQVLSETRFTQERLPMVDWLKGV